MKDLYVVNCCRTAIGSFGGSLKNTPAAEMGAIVVKEALKRANVAPENVDELMFGCILTAAQGQNVARQVSIKAGIPYSVPAYTVGMVCGSGMKSVIEGARSILAGDSDIVVCGGTENMSAAPYASMDARWGARMGDKKLVDTMIKDGLWDAYNNYHMGTTAENINDIWGITRREQDEFAAASQQKACAARDSGRFDDEIVAVPVKVKKEIVEFKRDEYVKEGVTADSIAKLKGAFPVGPESPNPQVVHTFEVTGAQDAADKGTQRVTAANASGINDGAAAIVLASGEAVEKYGLKPMAKLIGWGQGGVDPKIMGVGPVVASHNAMKKAGVTINEGNIRTLENGQRVIDLKQQKTGNHVIIPVRPELQAILDKYENRLPKSYEQKVNKYIKEVAREAGITEKIEVSYIENGEKKTHIVEKCDMVKTHTARRSGATNMYLAGIPTIAIMKITGHKTEKEFMKYIKITEEQTAMELMNHPYFSGK